jgi:hypothetical protein
MALNEAALHGIPVEIYLPSWFIGGTLNTKHYRLSNHLNLRAGDEALLLKNVRIQDLEGNGLPAACAEFLLYLQEVLFIADLSPTGATMNSDLDQQVIRKDPKRVLMHVSPFWIRGAVHLIPGATLNDLLRVKKRFIPVTDAAIRNRPAVAPCTFLVNGTKISCLAPDDASKI